MPRPSDWWVLDLPSDPTPGEVGQIGRLAARLTTIGDDAEYLSHQVRALAADNAVLTWIGAAGDAFRPAIGQFPGQLAKVASSHQMAGDALRRYASDLGLAQGQADRALAMGRQARDELASLQSRLTGAQSDLSDLSSAASAAHSAARLVAAQGQVSQLSAQVGGAQSQLDVAKRLAEQAGEMRSAAASTCATRVNAASDAGIHPDSFWHKLSEIAGEVWHYTVVVAKVVVAVGGIIALIIGGPIAWVVFAAALIVLADTLYKYSQGKASLWDVGLVLVTCIPMTRGLTSIGEIADAFRAGRAGAGLFGGVLGAGGHILVAGKGALVDTVGGLWRGSRAIPHLIHAAPFTALGKLTLMAAGLRFAGGGSLTGFVTGLRDGDGIFGSVREGASGLVSGWKDGVKAFNGFIESGDNPALKANSWQTTEYGYLGKDLWSNTTLPGGANVEVLYPGISGFATPEGTAASFGHDASQISQGVQVSAGDLATYSHNYRPSAVTLRINTEMNVATSMTRANSQYGVGGIRQYFIPNIADVIKSGNITIIGTDGAELTPDFSKGTIEVTAAGKLIQLHNLDLPLGSSLFSGDQFKNQYNGVMKSLGNIRIIVPVLSAEYSEIG